MLKKGGRVRIHTGSNGIPLGVFLEARRTAYEHEHKELGNIAKAVNETGLRGHIVEFANPSRPDVATMSRPATRIKNEMRSAYSVMANDSYGDNPRLKQLHGLLKKGGIPEIIIEVPPLPTTTAASRRSRDK